MAANGVNKITAKLAEAGGLVIRPPLPDSRGTADCMRKAKAAGIPVRTYRPATQVSSV